jgi:glucan phosphorylase
MKFSIPNPGGLPLHWLRRLGYQASPQRDSYVRRLSSAGYPRFHLYIDEIDEKSCNLSLHLDQKKVSYQGQKAHSGDYEGTIVIEEKKRIIDLLNLPN